MIRPLAFLCVLLAAAASAAEPVPADLRFVPDLGIGGEGAADDAYFLATVGSVVEDSRGNVYVGETKQECVFAFAPDGAFLRRMGRAGDGPADLMRHFTLAIDRADRIHVAGMGSRVEIVAADWTPIASFTRAHPTAVVRGVAVLPDGGFVIGAADVEGWTAVDRYGADHAHAGSFAPLLAPESGVPRRLMYPFVGGDVAAGPDGRIVYAQMAPFLLRTYTAAGAPLDSTTAGGADFVPPLPAPEIGENRVSYRGGPMVNGVAVLGDGSIVVTAGRHLDEETVESLCCLYDADLHLRGRRIATEWRRVVGTAADNRVYFAVGEPGANRVERTAVEVVAR